MLRFHRNGIILSVVACIALLGWYSFDMGKSQLLKIHEENELSKSQLAKVQEENELIKGQLTKIQQEIKQSIKIAREPFYLFPNDCLEAVILSGSKKKIPCITSGGNVKTMKPLPSEECYRYKIEPFLSRKVQLFYLNYVDSHKDMHDVTITINLSIDRFKMFETTAQRWIGPMSVALYVTEDELKQFVTYFTKSLVLANRTNIGIHVVFKDEDGYYPPNFLRNIALGQVHTPYVFMNDIDFLPVNGLYQYLRTVVASTDMNKKAIVVPAFETSLHEFAFPPNKSSLLSLVKSGKVQQFSKSLFPPGHGPTNYKKWETAKENYKVTWKKQYEPYLMVKKDGAPFFNPRFIAYGENKITQIMEIWALRYEFVVASNGFTIHVPHKFTKDRLKFLKEMRCVMKISKEVCEDLNKKYRSGFDCRNPQV